MIYVQAWCSIEILIVAGKGLRCGGGLRAFMLNESEIVLLGLKLKFVYELESVRF